MIPVNQPIVPVLTPTMRDGPMNTSSNEGGMPNYYPCSFNPNVQPNPQQYNERRERLAETDVDRFESSDEDNYTPVREFYLNFSQDQRNRLHTNIASSLNLAYDFIQQRALSQFEKIHTDYGEGVRRALQALRQSSNP